MSEDNITEQNEIQNENQNNATNESKGEDHDHTSCIAQNQNENQSINLNSNEKKNESEADPVFGQTQSEAEISQDPQPTLKDLKRQIAVLTARIEDANQHLMVREDNLRKNISDLTTQNALLRTHLKSLDNLIKKLSLLHSQLTAAPSYKLAKQDVEEMIRLITNISNI